MTVRQWYRGKQWHRGFIEIGQIQWRENKLGLAFAAIFIAAAVLAAIIS